MLYRFSAYNFLISFAFFRKQKMAGTSQRMTPILITSLKVMAAFQIVSLKTLSTPRITINSTIIGDSRVDRSQEILSVKKTFIQRTSQKPRRNQRQT